MMHYTRLASYATFMVALMAAAPVVAQPPGRSRERAPAAGGAPPGGPTIGFLGVKEAFEGKLVKDAPYQAEAVTEFTQTLADGNRIVRRSTATVARDSDGRTRREHALPAIGPLVLHEPPRTVFIHDPVAGVSYLLELDARIARRLRGRPPHFEGPEGLAFEIKLGRRGRERTNRTPETESLGKQTIEGVEAEGTRFTVTIPAGSFGNEKPIHIVSERWHSPELQVVVLSQHRDPRFGETSYRLTAITRGEPDHSLFEVPAGYTISDLPPRPGFGLGRKAPEEE